jgi:alkylated DNA nucleotide flippase Atl1/FMN phosphatase YigB (HAD superfamily)
MPENGVNERSKPSSNSYSRIYAVVNQIPAGRVATYGQVAVLAGLSGHARQVGYALNALPEGLNIPWHRVINAKGRISRKAESAYDDLQQLLLEAEGVVFDGTGSVSLEEFRWRPGARQRQCVLFDWGDTVMRVFAEYSGPMDLWPRVEAVEGVGEALAEIRRDSLVCLATNAADSDERAIRRALDRAGLEMFFDHVFCFDVVGARKPSAAFFQFITKHLALDSDCVFMVGDDFDNDVRGANANGIGAVWLNQITRENRNSVHHKTIFSLDSLLCALESLGFCRARV